MIHATNSTNTAIMLVAILAVAALGALATKTQVQRGKLEARLRWTPQGPVYIVSPEEVERYREQSKGKPGRRPGKG